jgi:hypothetical protein
MGAGLPVKNMFGPASAFLSLTLSLPRGVQKAGARDLLLHSSLSYRGVAKKKITYLSDEKWIRNQDDTGSSTASKKLLFPPEGGGLSKANNRRFCPPNTVNTSVLCAQCLWRGDRVLLSIQDHLSVALALVSCRPWGGIRGGGVTEKIGGGGETVVGKL